MMPETSLRDRKRRETLRRITDTAIGLFIQKGYDATTLDDIAAAAGISRRTFFYYFKSKDDILLSLQSGMGEMIVDALRDASPTQKPLIAVRDAVMKVCEPFSGEEMIAIDRLMRSSETVLARKQASYVQHERTLLAALREKWPEPEREMALRMVAMLSIGAIRLTTETLNREGGARSFAELIREAFAALESEI